MKTINSLLESMGSSADRLYDAASTSLDQGYEELTADLEDTVNKVSDVVRRTLTAEYTPLQVPEHTEDSFDRAALDLLDGATEEEVQQLVDMGAIPGPEDIEQRTIERERQAAQRERVLSQSSNVSEIDLKLPPEVKLFILLVIIDLIIEAFKVLFNRGIKEAKKVLQTGIARLGTTMIFFHQPNLLDQ